MQSQWFNGRALGSQYFPAADQWINEKESEQEVHKSDDSVEEEPGFSSDTAYDPETDNDIDMMNEHRSVIY